MGRRFAQGRQRRAGRASQGAPCVAAVLALRARRRAAAQRPLELEASAGAAGARVPARRSP